MTTLILEKEPIAAHVQVTETDLVIQLTDGRTLSVPLHWYPRLTHATVEERRIAQVYRRYKRHPSTLRQTQDNASSGQGLPDDEAGVCKIATLDQIRAHDYKLTPGIYVGTQANGEDAEAFEEKMPRLTEDLRTLFTESDRLQALILADLEGLA
jgi:type I restriction-modification system DNA methylase subunit